MRRKTCMKIALPCLQPVQECNTSGIQISPPGNASRTSYGYSSIRHDNGKVSTILSTATSRKSRIDHDNLLTKQDVTEVFAGLDPCVSNCIVLSDTVRVATIHYVN
eukprot:5341796-Amphidinium_carterae.1